MGGSTSPRPARKTLQASPVVRLMNQHHRAIPPCTRMANVFDPTYFPSVETRPNRVLSFACTLHLPAFHFQKERDLGWIAPCAKNSLLPGERRQYSGRAFPIIDH